MILYKYMGSERIDVLQNMHIRFTEPGLFNDPFESLVAISSFGPDSDVHRVLQDAIETIDEEEWKKEREKDQENVSLAEFKEYSKHNPDRALEVFRKWEPSAYDDQRRKLYELINNAVCILPLAESANSLLMWAHYADHHKGFVLGLDHDHDFFHPIIDEGDPINIIDKVIYSKSRPSIMISDPDPRVLFLHKSDDWAYEAEWRYIKYLEDADKRIVADGKELFLYKLPPSCITKVILGCRMHEFQKNEFVKTLRRDPSLSHVELYHAGLDKEQYVLRFKQIAL